VPDEFIIRPFAEHDVPAVLALNNANIPELNELDAAEVLRLATIADAALTAEVNGAFAGFCWVLSPGKEYGSLNYGWFSRNYTDFVYLDRIAVLPEYRRYGIGRAFYAELVRQFTGVWSMIACEVNIRPYNERSLTFHHSIGFREVGQQETDGGNKTVSLLALPLSATSA
jgi:predicted GNAT superfamily acetyltransferase